MHDKVNLRPSVEHSPSLSELADKAEREAEEIRKSKESMETEAKDALKENPILAMTSLSAKLGHPTDSGISQGSISLSESLETEKSPVEEEKEEEPVEEVVNETPTTTNEERKDVLEKFVSEDPDDNFIELCRACVIRDLVGCDHCGIFMYGYKHKGYKIKVEKI